MTVTTKLSPQQKIALLKLNKSAHWHSPSELGVYQVTLDALVKKGLAKISFFNGVAELPIYRISHSGRCAVVDFSRPVKVNHFIPSTGLLT